MNKNFFGFAFLEFQIESMEAFSAIRFSIIFCQRWKRKFYVHPELGYQLQVFNL